MPAKEMIRQFIVTELLSDCNGDGLTDTIPLIEEGIIDSFGIMTLLGYLEENFAIEITPDELVPENFASITTINDFIAQKDSFQMRS